MSGIQAVPAASAALEPRAPRIAPAEHSKNIEGQKNSRPEYQPVAGAKEEKSTFSQELSEETKKKLEDELKKVNDSLVSYGKLLRFRYNEEAQQTYVEVVDAESQEVVASLPPEFLVDLSIKMKEMIGMFVDKKL